MSTDVWSEGDYLAGLILYFFTFTIMGPKDNFGIGIVINYLNA